MCSNDHMSLVYTTSYPEIMSLLPWALKVNNNILLWGFNTHRLIKLQKRAIIVITDSKYNSHTEPLLKSLNILKINDIFTIQCLTFFS